MKTAAEEYWMNHRPGGPGVAEEEGTAAPAHALDRVYPKDVYTHPHLYGSGNGLHGGQKAFHETVNTIRKIRGNPDAPVTMYRSLPPEHAKDGFRTGDWVSLHHSYAEGHGLHPTDPSKDWPVIKQTVPAKHLWNNGDSLDEFGYHGPPTHGEISKHATKVVSTNRLGTSVERIAILLGSAEGMLDPRMRVVAHVSGNAINVLHCPFCGSGAVIARSDGTIECGYCTSVFTVQVQPAYNGFPQSVDGQDYAWPGQPAPEDTLAPTPPPGTNLAPGTVPPGGDPMADPSMGMDGPPESSDPADGGDPDAEGDEDSDDDKPAFLKGKGDKKDDKSKDKGKKGKNPFAKGSSYRTVNGAELPVDEFLAHLAISTSPNQFATAQKVRRARLNGEL